MNENPSLVNISVRILVRMGVRQKQIGHKHVISKIAAVIYKPAVMNCLYISREAF